MNQRLPIARLRQPWVLVLLSAVAAIAAYLQALDYPFVADDILYVVGNKNLAALHLSELWRLLIAPYNPSFEFLPLRDFSYWIDITLFGQNPAAFRLHNIFLYLLCLPLVYATSANLWRHFRPLDAASAPWAAAVVTALFALHPALVESVVWISGRKYILPNLFSLLALWLAVNVKREHGFSSGYALATLLALMAVMFSKSSYVAVAAVIATLWLIYWRELAPPQRSRSLLLWPLSALALAAFLLVNFIVRNKGYDTAPVYPGVEAIIRSFAVLGGLARISISPEARHFYHPVFDSPWLGAMVALGAVVLCAAAWGAVTLLRKRSLAGFSMLAFLLLCIPYLQLLPGKPPSLVSDRYVALAIWPAILLLVVLAWRFKPLPRTILLLLFALPWAYQTMERPRDWRSESARVEADFLAYPEYYAPASYAITFRMQNGLRHEAQAAASRISSPEIRNVLTKMILADQILRVDAVSSSNPHAAIARLEELENLLDEWPAQSKWDTPMIFIWTNFMKLLSNEWLALAESFPDDVMVRYHTGKYLFRLHSYSDAVVHLRAAIESNQLPQDLRGKTYKNLGIALLDLGRITEAEAALRMAPAQSPPELPAYCLLSELYTLTNRPEEAAHAAINCPERASIGEAAQ